MLLSMHNAIGNMFEVKTTDEADGTTATIATIYVNSGYYLVKPPSNANAITQSKIDSYNSDPIRKPGFTTLVDRYLCMHVVQKLECNDSVVYQCNCLHFHMSGYSCSHVISCMHRDELLDVFGLLATVVAPKKRGRPKKSGNPLKKDAGLNDVAIADPAVFRNCMVRHPVYKTGVVSGTTI